MRDVYAGLPAPRLLRADGTHAFLVSVDYSDLLALTLPYNRHHFDTVTVITSHADLCNVAPIARANNAEVYTTDAFYRQGASFNKWLALEEGLDAVGRQGWICLMDADILWPKVIPDYPRQIGKLYSPLRHMMTDIDARVEGGWDIVPPESKWAGYPIHPNRNEWAGYSQIFHANDPHLGPTPWHQVDWLHAGGSDSFFQQKWPSTHKVRPPWNCLHLGEAGVNWLGRASRRLDGTVPDGADEKRQALRAMWSRRRLGPGRFDGEKIK